MEPLLSLNAPEPASIAKPSAEHPELAPGSDRSDQSTSGDPIPGDPEYQEEQLSLF
ncbi:hypothetical protein [Oceanospirillum sediminis]|uniref:Uncharacterized protein n=1 Tax=Oceanospirillum sediminis TaxID=2760088 RepID=A0A839IM77_9GAMM|nr:hypothetical protein [Oceanospirillum sediminis]MBB1485820.1 hypothetical protein [Oceanospirillum sediminis]